MAFNCSDSVWLLLLFSTTKCDNGFYEVEEKKSHRSRFISLVAGKFRPFFKINWTLCGFLATWRHRYACIQNDLLAHWHCLNYWIHISKHVLSPSVRCLCNTSFSIFHSLGKRSLSLSLLHTLQLYSTKSIEAKWTRARAHGLCVYTRFQQNRIHFSDAYTLFGWVSSGVRNTHNSSD